MLILCGGIIESAQQRSIAAHPISVECLDPHPAGQLASQLFSAILSSSSSSSVSAYRHVSYPVLSDLRKALLAPVHLPVEGSNNENNSGTRASTSSSFTAFSPEISNQILFEAEEYAKGEEKLCTSAAFVFHRLALNSDGKTLNHSSVGSSQNISSITLWLMVHLLPEVGSTGNSSKRILDLTNTATILARWAELCFTEDHFKALVSSTLISSSSVIPGSSSNSNSGSSSATTNNSSTAGHQWSEGAIAVALSSLDECAGEFNDARHAAVEMKFAPES